MLEVRIDEMDETLGKLSLHLDYTSETDEDTECIHRAVDNLRLARNYLQEVVAGKSNAS